MAKTKACRGIYAREASLLIDLRAFGYGRERLDVPPTEVNKRAAARIRDDIERKVGLGTFDLDAYAEHFPNSPYLKKIGYNAAKDGSTFSVIADQWLAIKTAELSSTTVSEYTSVLKQHFRPLFGGRPIREITYEDLALFMAGIKFESSKTFNNCMTPLRGVFAYALKTKKIKVDPTKDIGSRRNQKPAPDPLELDEVELIIGKILERHGEQAHNDFEFSFFTGVRPSELIALRWSHIDFRRETVRIEAARVRSKDKDTKTHKARDVDLNERALNALLRQKKHTFMVGEHVFVNPFTGRLYADTSIRVEKIWRPALKALGIRNRDARQTRHTFATICLMAGMNPAYIARQMGHENAKMFFEVYSKWIDGADKGREKNKLNQFMSQAAQDRKIVT